MQDALEIIPIDTAAELLSRTAQIHDARRRTLLQLWQQQLRQEHRTKVVGPERDLHCQLKYKEQAYKLSEFARPSASDNAVHCDHACLYESSRDLVSVPKL